MQAGEKLLMSAIAAALAGLAAETSLRAAPATNGAPPRAAKPADTTFWIGRADGTALEFGGAKEGWQEFARQFPGPVTFTVGQDKPAAWPYIHHSSHDTWAGGTGHRFTVNFQGQPAQKRPLNLILGFVSCHPTPSQLEVKLNGRILQSGRLPAGAGHGDPGQWGDQKSLNIAIPEGTIRPGANRLELALTDGSWVIYDYLYLGPNSQPPMLTRKNEKLLDRFKKGPLAGVDEFVFAARRMNETDGHWYANLGYYAHDPDRKAWREGAHLYRWSLSSGRLTTLLDDPRGGVRDPQAHYDGRKILFSYRKGGTETYHLYEIQSDGTGLRQITDGAYDDIEPTYLPDGDIVFVSTRCKRWVNCWLTQVAVMYRCDANGQNVRPISSNNEHDNTPWPLHDGRLLYTRWEYVDRSQVDYHHLWVSNPDGTSQINWFGNLHPGIVMIDAKPVPGSDKVVAIFSPGHGQREHAGAVTLVDPKGGPDDKGFATRISRGNQLRDPWAFSEDCFIAADGPALVLMDETGASQELFRLPEADVKAGMHLHEPRPLAPRPREGLIPDRSAPQLATGRLLLADVYEGRNMTGVKRGEIKKLLVLETLPMPIHYTGGMDPISYGGTFTLERVVGTVPVEPDGSANMELPALRSFFFVALDDQDRAVKRMQSFLTVQPGEVTGCVGCHEQRTRTPSPAAFSGTLAFKKPPTRVTPIEGVPDVFDFPRDIQPILDDLCVQCHGYEKTPVGGPRDGRLILSGDRGPMFSHSYYMMTVARLFSDGRNRARSNYGPRELGSSASRILAMLDGSHYDMKASPEQKRMLRLWIESGAAYPGTYAALGSGMIGNYAENQPVNTDWDWPTTRAAGQVIEQRCASCHSQPARLLPRSLSDERGVSFWQPQMGDPRLNTSRHIVFNLTHPEKSILLLAPLAREAGGWGLCKASATGKPAPVFASSSDPGYRTLLEFVQAGQRRLNEMKRFDMPDFRPRVDWVREMKRYGILTVDAKPTDPIDVYATERRYWESLWWQPQAR